MMLGLGGVLPAGELQQQTFTFDLKNPQPMISLLRGLTNLTEANQLLRHLFIHEADPYSAAPGELVVGRDHAPANGKGSTMAWYMVFSRANSSTKPRRGQSTPKIPREVRGGDGEVCGYWRTEGSCRKQVVDSDSRPAGYWRTLYYWSKASSVKLGWCMTEFWLEQQDGADQHQHHHLVLCKMYRSNRNKYGESSTAADAEAGALTRGAALPLSIIPAGTGGEISSCETGAASSSIIPRTLVMAFDGSSIPSADRIKDVASYILSLTCTHERPVIVLSAMGMTATNIQLAAEKALSCDAQNVVEIPELAAIEELHLGTVHQLGLKSSVVSGLLQLLVQHLQGVAITKNLTPLERYSLASFGEQMSAAIFCAYLDVLRIITKQFTPFYVSFETTGGFRHGDILEAAYAAVTENLQIHDSCIPVVTSFVGKACKPGSITTLGADFTATIIGKALGLRKIEIWKDLNGVLTGDPNICTNVKSVPCLTFDEAIELACSGAEVLHPESMRLAMKWGIPVIVLKNSCNPQAPGTVITQTRDMSKSILSSIVLKPNIVMLDVLSMGATSHRNFHAQVSILQDSGICVNHEATSGGDICLTLHTSKLCDCELTQKEIVTVVEELKKIAIVVKRERISMISLIGNPEKLSFILCKAFDALGRIGVNTQKISQRSSKVMNVSLVVNDSEAKRCVQVLHSAFLENGFFSNVEGADDEFSVPVNSSSSRVKRKAEQDHPEAPPSVRPERVQPVQMVAEGDSGPGNALEEIDRILFSEDPMDAGGDNGGESDESWTRLLVSDDSLDEAGVLPFGGAGQSTPVSVTEVDAEQGSRTAPDGPEDTENLILEDAPTPVVDPAEFLIHEDYPGQYDLDGYTQEPFQFDDGSCWIITEEMLENSPDDLLGPSPGDMPGPAPAFS